jgi:hypothetical protein
MKDTILSLRGNPAVPSQILGRNFESKNCVIPWKIWEVNFSGEGSRHSHLIGWGL